MYIKDFNTFMFHKTKNKNKKWFCKSCLQCFSSENMFIKHKEDFLSINGTQSADVEERKKYHDHVPCSYAYKVVCIDNRFSKPIVIYRGKDAAYEFIKAIIKEYKYCKKIMKKHFNKNLIMSEEEKHLFQQSNSCWICGNLLIMTMKK